MAAQVDQVVVAVKTLELQQQVVLEQVDKVLLEVVPLKARRRLVEAVRERLEAMQRHP
jgi:hypothetical protein